jgi:hypothetical protein
LVFGTLNAKKLTPKSSVASHHPLTRTEAAMPAFGASELDKLTTILEEVLTEAKARGIGLTRELAARRLFDAARSGLSDEAALKADG